MTSLSIFRVALVVSAAAVPVSVWYLRAAAVSSDDPFPSAALTAPPRSSPNSGVGDVRAGAVLPLPEIPSRFTAARGDGAFPKSIAAGPPSPLLPAVLRVDLSGPPEKNQGVPALSFGVIPGRGFNRAPYQQPVDPRTGGSGSAGGGDADVRPLHYVVGGATHEWIAFQGYMALPAGDLKSDMAQYLSVDINAPEYGTFLNGQSIDSRWLDIIGPEYENANHAIVPANALIQGVYEEDAEGQLDGTIDGVHFWNPDGGYNAGLVLDGTPYLSALQEAQEETFPKALAAWPDRKAEAYYWLGRTAHLLADVSVPAHTLLDGHAALSTDDDQFEKFTSGKYKDINALSPNAAIPSALPWTVPAGYPAGYDPELTRLFYNLAKTSRQFDSDDVNGTSTEFGMGKFRFARNALAAGRTVARVEYWNSNVGVPSDKRRDLIAGTDYAIQTTGEFRIYYYQSFYDDINNTSRMVRVIYSDGTDEFFLNLDESPGDVFEEPLQHIYQTELEARAIGYTAALYQLFWSRTGTPRIQDFLITSVRRVPENGGGLEIKFRSEAAATYRVHRSTSLTVVSWTDAGVSATGNGAEQTIVVPDDGTAPRQFFRVVKM